MKLLEQILLKGAIMKIFVTADQHFGHSNIIRLKERPFQSTKEMNERMIELWNSVVSADDTVYVLGDFIGKEPIETEIVKQIGTSLNGHKVLLKGNHDKGYPMADIFEEVYPQKKVIDFWYQHTHFFMNHWRANMTISGNLPSEIYLHAHLHGRIGYNMINAFYRRPYYDVGVDANNFTPVGIDEIINFFSRPPKDAPRVKCKECGAQLIERKGPYGRFLGCSRYPECTFVENLEIDRRTATEKNEHRNLLKRRR